MRSVLTARNSRTLILLLLLLATSMIAGSTTAQASFGVRPGSLTANAYKSDGTLDTQAAAHPDEVRVNFDLNLRSTTIGQVYPDENIRDLVVDLPRGFVGDPRAAPTCRAADLGQLPFPTCPAASQVGVISIDTYAGGYPATNTVPVFNMEPPRGTLVDFGFALSLVPIHIISRLAPDRKYAVRTTVTNVSQVTPLGASRLTLWGVPADPRHNGQRGPKFFCASDQADPSCSGPAFNGGEESGTAPAAFLTNPAECGPIPLTSMRLRSWQQPDVWEAASTQSPPVTGCERLKFAPSLDVTAPGALADSPTGLGVGLAFPQSANPDALATPPLRKVTVALPDGLTINPASAGGLQACSDDELGLGTDAASGCPEASRIGSVVAESPAVDGPLTGSIYLRPQNSDDPASGEMFRLAIELRNDDRGLEVKLPGQARVDPSSGKIVTEFDDNPQLPVSSIRVTLKDGARAPVATPAQCGAVTSTADLAAWSGQTAHLQSSFGVGCRPGVGAFAPTVKGGTIDAAGGAFSPFALSIIKPDGNAVISGLSMTLPTGLVAKLKGNLGTQVGTVKALAGSGTSPFTLPGKVFLEGQYGDAPFSLRVVVPAKAGPFDLGEVVVRQKIYVDPITAQVTVVSDPIPTIVKGVPARLQRLDVNVDKAGFVINPTSCAAKAIGGTLRAVDGQTAPINVRFQTSDCASLPLKPALALSLSGKGQTTDGKHPAISAVLSQPAAQANLKKVRVTLPLSLALDVDNANGLCEFADGSKVTPACPKNSIIGTATALTPILDEPLSGPVYFVKNERKDPKSGRSIKTLPKLVIPLVGQNGVKLTLTGTSDVKDDQLVTTFDNIPDAPVSSFMLNINGGKGGILAVSGDKTDICKATQIADQQIDGQNNKRADADVYIQTPSCPLKVLSKKVGKRSVTVKIGGLGAGRVTITGKGIKKATKVISKSTVATLTARRATGTPGKVTVTYDPTGPAKARKVTK